MKTDQLPRPQVLELTGALAVPRQQGDNAPHGVFYPDKQFCELSRTRLSRGRETETPEWVPAQGTLDGHHIYAGHARLHFGHFLVESFARAWAFEHIGPDVRSIVLLPFPMTGNTQWITRKYAALWSAVAGGCPVRVLQHPTRVERLSIPSQGFGHGAWLSGTPEFRHFIRSRLSAAFPAEGPERLYISRSGLKDADKQVYGEAQIEQALQAKGYTIFRPEQHSLESQCAHYAAARQIIGADGSAFHLLPFVARPDAQIAIYLRRNRANMLKLLRRQVKSFTGVEPLLIDARQHKDPIEKAQPTPIVPGAVLAELSAHGFL